jgi:hypothetical protein
VRASTSLLDAVPDEALQGRERLVYSKLFYSMYEKEVDSIARKVVTIVSSLPETAA